MQPKKSRKQLLEEMLLDEPNDAELRYTLAMEYVSDKNDVGALACFYELFRVAPSYPPGYHQAGRTAVRLGRIDEARTLLQQGIRVAKQCGDDHAAGEMGDLLASLE